VLRHFEFSHNGKRYRAHVIPFPPDGVPSHWYISVDNGPRHRLFESSADDVPGVALERRLLEAYARHNG
jgi:hypothetical protein